MSTAFEPDPIMSPILAGMLIALLFVLHQDIWFWRSAHPLVFGFMPIGLFYHAAYTAACSLLMWVLVTYLWPAHLESAGRGGTSVRE